MSNCFKAGYNKFSQTHRHLEDAKCIPNVINSSIDFDTYWLLHVGPNLSSWLGHRNTQKYNFYLVVDSHIEISPYCAIVLKNNAATLKYVQKMNQARADGQ